MRRYRKACAPEYRERMLELVRSGRSPEALAREFEPNANINHPSTFTGAGRVSRR